MKSAVHNEPVHNSYAFFQAEGFVNDILCTYKPIARKKTAARHAMMACHRHYTDTQYTHIYIHTFIFGYPWTFWHSTSAAMYTQTATVAIAALIINFTLPVVFGSSSNAPATDGAPPADNATADADDANADALMTVAAAAAALDGND